MDPSQFADDDEGGLNLNDWEQIQSPPREFDTVAVTDGQDEDSQASYHDDDDGQHQQPNSPSQPSSSSSSDVSSSNSSPGVAADDVGRQLRLRLKIFGSAMVRNIAAKVRYCAVYVGGFWSFAAMAGLVATALLSSLYCARVRTWRRRVRRQEENNNRLILLIKEKDQKINQLLLQVSQMNQLLTARRKVSVIRIG